MPSSFCGGHKLLSKSPVRAWRQVIEGDVCVVLGLFMLMGIILTPTLR
jgi:hypothetical protein